MELILGASVAIGLSLLIVKTAIDSALSISGEVSDFRAVSKITRYGWTDTTGTVERLGVNVDFPQVIFNWPKVSDYESTDAYDDAIVKANQEVIQAGEKQRIFGNVLIEYSYKDEAGNNYRGRTIGRLPDHDKDAKLAMSLSIGQSIKVYYRKDEPELSALRKTSDEAYKEYTSKLVRPALSQGLGGLVLFVIAVVALAIA